MNNEVWAKIITALLGFGVGVGFGMGVGSSQKPVNEMPAVIVMKPTISNSVVEEIRWKTNVVKIPNSITYIFNETNRFTNVVYNVVHKTNYSTRCLRCDVLRTATNSVEQ
jgi:hypothetical protein